MQCYATPCLAILMLYSRTHFSIQCLCLCLCLLPAAIRFNGFVLNLQKSVLLCLAFYMIVFVWFSWMFISRCHSKCWRVKCAHMHIVHKCTHPVCIGAFHLKIINAWTVYGNVPSKFMCIALLPIELHSNYKCKWYGEMLLFQAK